jgi:hypothetical protein
MKLGSIEALRQAEQATSAATVVVNCYGTLNSADMTRAKKNIAAGHSRSYLTMNILNGRKFGAPCKASITG